MFIMCLCTCIGKCKCIFENIFIQLYMYVLYVVIVTYKSSLAGRSLYNTTTVFILMYTHVTLINIIYQIFIKMK